MDSKLLKLVVHQRNYSDEDLLLSAKDMPGLQIGDVVEISDPSENFTRLLLEVRRFRDELQSNTISVEANLAAAFHLRAYRDVLVQVIRDRESIELNLIELQFRDFYLSRSDMWQLISTLRGRCMHLNKKVEFLSARFHVLELWAHGRKVACGIVTADTKVVFRSASANCTLFVQLSEESWQSDTAGDLYFEKGMWFLRELFSRWREESATHDVTIVVFSRVIYHGDDFFKFPLTVRECLLRDRKGRFYEDFYRVIVQNERYDDWTQQLPKLKQLFAQHRDSVLNFHRSRGIKRVPVCHLSSAKTGGLLEVLNMAIQLFERHNIDRNFERTGQMCVVVSPGVGVFEVDREMLHISRQRSLDYGIGNDLVFLGEQPLHVVPLYMLYNREGLLTDYYIPNWLNYSYFCGPFLKNGQGYPRVRRITPLDTMPSQQQYNGDVVRDGQRPAHAVEDNQQVAVLHAGAEARRKSYGAYKQLTPAEMDAYDNDIFKPVRKRRPNFYHNDSNAALASDAGKGRLAASVQDEGGPHLLHRSRSTVSVYKKSFGSSDDAVRHNKNNFVSFPERDKFFPIDNFERVFRVAPPRNNRFPLVLSPNRSNNGFLNSLTPQSPLQLPDRLMAALDLNVAPTRQSDAAGDSSRTDADRPGGPPSSLMLLQEDPSKALINPFSPSDIPIKTTPNRRRWVHAFPQNPAGQAVQTHHTERRQSTLTGITTTPTKAASILTAAGSLSSIPGSVHESQPSPYGTLLPNRSTITAARYRNSSSNLMRNSVSGDASYRALTAISDTEDSDAATVASSTRRTEATVQRPNALSVGDDRLASGAPLPFNRNRTGGFGSATNSTLTTPTANNTTTDDDDDLVSTITTTKGHRPVLDLSSPQRGNVQQLPSSAEAGKQKPSFGIVPRSRAVKSLSVVQTTNFSRSTATSSLLTSAATSGRPGRRTQSIQANPLSPGTPSAVVSQTSNAAVGKKFAWGITGEQEWTPHTITTVDWKSLTVPACLPVTTDYLPDDKALREDFQINEYNVMLEESGLDFAADAAAGGAASGRKMLTLDQLYKELINQRLQAGFQLIVRESTNMLKTDDAMRYNSLVSMNDVQSPLAPPPPPPPFGVTETSAFMQIDDVCYLSFGSIYHRLFKNEPNKEVEVTMYTPRHRTKCPQKPYRYRFKVPDAETYDVSSVVFSHERVDYWNHVDMCVAGMGRGDMPLDAKMKYWRTHLAILPCSAAPIKAISDGTAKRCDIFAPKSSDEMDALCDGFLRLLEALNHVRRPVATRRTARRAVTNNNLSATAVPSSGLLRPPLNARTASLSVGTPTAVNNALLLPQPSPLINTNEPDSQSSNESGVRIAVTGDDLVDVESPAAKASNGLASLPSSAAKNNDVNNNNLSAKNAFPRITTVLDLRRGSEAAHLAGGAPSANRIRTAAAQRTAADAPKFSHSSSSAEILRAMMLPSEGVNISTRNADLPPNCFISADAIEWAAINILGCAYIEQAAEVFEVMLEKKLIWPMYTQEQQTTLFELQNAFVYGFYLYCCSPSVWTSAVENTATTKEASTVSVPPPPSAVAQQQQYSNEDWVQVSIINPGKSITAVLDDSVGGNAVDSIRPLNSEYQMFAGNLPSSPTGQPSSVPRFEKLDNIHESYRSCYRLNTFRDAVVDPVTRQRQSSSDNSEYERTEWVSARFFSTYHPLCAYEIELRWLVASGLTLGETLSTWCRKAPACGFHILPIPYDPFAMPSDVDSDPLRGPLFVRVDLKPLRQEHEMFRLTASSGDADRMRIVLFLETIAKAFGFIHSQSNCIDKKNNFTTLQRRYIHCCGGMFLMIRELQDDSVHNNAVCWRFEHLSAANTNAGKGGIRGKSVLQASKRPFYCEECANSTSAGKQSDGDESDSSQVSLAKSISGADGTSYVFMWTWNSLLTRRYKSSFTGEEAFLDTMLKDFRSFCRNEDDRLLNFFRQQLERVNSPEQLHL